METIAVRFRDCRCPGTPHPDGDVAQLRPYLDYAGGAEALRTYTRLMADLQAEYPDLDMDGEPFRVMLTDRSAPIIGPVFIRRGVVDWNVVDEDGEPVPCTPEALDALRWEDAYALGDQADDLYGSQVFAPFQSATDASSPNGRTVASTRTPTRSSRKRHTPSKR